MSTCMPTVSICVNMGLRLSWKFLQDAIVVGTPPFVLAHDPTDCMAPDIAYCLLTSFDTRAQMVGFLVTRAMVRHVQEVLEGFRALETIHDIPRGRARTMH